MQLKPSDERVARFAADLDQLVGRGGKLGVAVSGGPDSVALLMLAAAARPGSVEAVTLDHGLRPESRSEAEFVARICNALGVPHTILTAEWSSPPQSAIQERARTERYRLFGQWMQSHDIAALATGHHVEDQAETLVMRLNRGAGVQGLAAIRQVAAVPGTDLTLVRPLLGWRRAELAEVREQAGVSAINDPSNENEEFERIRIRRGLAEADWIDGAALARSASNLADADAALQWAVANVWRGSVTEQDGAILFDPAELPREIRRRVVASAIVRLGGEGEPSQLRGRELEQLMASLRSGGIATLRGVRCSGGEVWRFEPAAPRS